MLEPKLLEIHYHQASRRARWVMSIQFLLDLLHRHRRRRRWRRLFLLDFLVVGILADYFQNLLHYLEMVSEHHYFHHLQTLQDFLVQ
jgi:hypothetical protein